MNLDRIKLILRESEMPMFSDEEILRMISDVGAEKALYELLILKSENTALQISGFSAADTSSYFLRLANTYRPHNTGVLRSAT